MERTPNQSFHSNSPHSFHEDEEINVFLKVMKTVAINVKRSDTVGSIKSLVYEKEGITENLLELFFNGDRLKDEQRILDYGIQKDSTLHMILQNSARMKLLVMIPSKQKSIMVEARTYDTIQQIKSIILEKEGIQPDQYNLIYAGKVLEDDKNLVSLNVQNESTLHLVFNPKDMVSFYVVAPTGDTVSLKVKVLYSISDVKAIIGGLIGVLVRDYDLIYEGKQLEDSKSLAWYNIQEESVLRMSSRSFQIFVKAWSGKTITLDVHQHDTVQEVKSKIFQKLGVPDYFQSIVFGGKRLDVDRDLAYYNIQKHATLHTVFSPKTITKEMALYEIGAPGEQNSTTKIGDLKAMIQKKIPYPVKEVYYHGKPLQDEQTLGTYNIGMFDTLLVVSAER